MDIVHDKKVYIPPSAREKFITNLEDVVRIRGAYKALGRRVVFAQGVWDLLHRGHLRYLYAASRHGDVLVVGVDSDALTRKRKGKGRPIVPQKERVEMLSFIKFIDHIVIHDVDQKIGDLVQAVSPDVFIVSETTKDFPPEDVLVYQECCGKIVRLREQARTSSTERVRQLAIEGEEQGKAEVLALLGDFLEKARRK